MSFWRKPPREVYRVYAEDDFLSDEGIRPGECTVRPIDVDASGVGSEGEHPHMGAHQSPVLDAAHEHRRPRMAGVATLACLTTVTLLAGALILLHIFHTPASAERAAAARHAFLHVERQAVAGEPATAPPKVHVPQQRQRKARVPNRRTAHPRRLRLRIAAEHEEILKRAVLGPPTLPLSAGHDFDFER